MFYFECFVCVLCVVDLFHFAEKFYLEAQVLELINSDELENVSLKLAIYSADLVKQTWPEVKCHSWKRLKH